MNYFLKIILTKFFLIKLSLKATLREKRFIKIYYKNYFIHKWKGGALVSPSHIKNPIKETTMSLDLFTKYYSPKKNDIIVDVGAGIGTELNYFSKAVGPKGKIICIEADPLAFKCLRKLSQVLKIKNAIFINNAVGEKKKISYLFQNSPACIGNFIENKKNDKNTKVNINTLDNIIKKLNLKKIDYLKINIEGSEINALKGLRKKFYLVENFCISCHDFIGIKTYNTVKNMLKKKINLKTNKKNINKPWEEFYLYANK